MTAPDLTKLTSLHKERYGRIGLGPGTPADPALCCEEVSDRQSWISYSQCARKRGYGPEGAYCKQHDPDAVKAKKAARDAKWEAEWAEKQRKHEAASLAPKMKAALIAIRDGHNDPAALAAEVLGEFKHDRA